jgi:hypothetical protein
MCRLRRFKVKIHSDSADMDEISILAFFMRSLCISFTSPATLEHIQLEIFFDIDHFLFDYHKFYEDLHKADVWRHLDTIVTLPIGSRLRRVDIDIAGVVGVDYEEEKDDIREAVLSALPRLRSKNILHLS